jgi:hypothetical protein
VGVVVVVVVGVEVVQAELVHKTNPALDFESQAVQGYAPQRLRKAAASIVPAGSGALVS